MNKDTELYAELTSRTADNVKNIISEIITNENTKFSIYKIDIKIIEKIFKEKFLKRTTKNRLLDSSSIFIKMLDLVFKYYATSLVSLESYIMGINGEVIEYTRSMVKDYLDTVKTECNDEKQIQKIDEVLSKIENVSSLAEIDNIEEVLPDELYESILDALYNDFSYQSDEPIYNPQPLVENWMEYLYAIDYPIFDYKAVFAYSHEMFVEILVFLNNNFTLNFYENNKDVSSLRLDDIISDTISFVLYGECLPRYSIMLPYEINITYPETLLNNKNISYEFLNKNFILGFNIEYYIVLIDVVMFPLLKEITNISDEIELINSL